MTTGEYIRTRRKQKNITQEELAKRIGTGHSVISKYENGQIDPSIEVLYKIADALEIPRDLFLLDVFDAELIAISQSKPDLTAPLFVDQPPNYGIDLSGLLEQGRQAIKEGNPEKAKKIQNMLKRALPDTFNKLTVYQNLQDVIQEQNEEKLLKSFHNLNNEGQQIAADVVEGLAKNKRYQCQYGDLVQDVPRVKNLNEHSPPHTDGGVACAEGTAE